MIPAPLYAPLDGAAAWVEAADGGRLRAAVFPAHGTARGSVVVSPGRTEPVEKYAEVIGELQARGFAVLVHDWRGQGLSQPFARVGGEDGVRHGHARGWRLFLDDFGRVLDSHAARLPRPWIALGHSMGGGLTLLAMAEGAVRFDAAILSAPLLGLRLGGWPRALVKAVVLLMSLFGRAGRPTPPVLPDLLGYDSRSGEPFTHDAQRWGRVVALVQAHPELRIGQPTWGWLQFAFALTIRLEAMRGLEAIGAPVTVVVAGHDSFVPRAPQKAAAARLPRGRYVEVAGAFHELLIETDKRRAVFWEAFDALAAGMGV